MILAQKTDRTRSSYWLVRPGSIHELLVQLSLGDTVEKCHAWSPPVLSFSRSHPAEKLQRALARPCSNKAEKPARLSQKAGGAQAPLLVKANYGPIE